MFKTLVSRMGQSRATARSTLALVGKHSLGVGPKPSLRSLSQMPGKQAAIVRAAAVASPLQPKRSLMVGVAGHGRTQASAAPSH